MPKRATLTFASSDNAATSGALHVLYCRYTGRHALSTDCDMTKAPRRRTDGTIVLDTEFYTVKLYTSEGATKLIKRKSGKVERQIRVNIGQIPIGYRSELQGRFLYIFSDALSEYSAAQGHNKRRPAPPCIARISPDTVQVTLEVEDMRPNAGLIKISRDYVRVQIMQPIAHDKAAEELLELMRVLLGGRLGQLSIVRGQSARQKLLLIQGISPDVVFEKLEATL